MGCVPRLGLCVKFRRRSINQAVAAVDGDGNEGGIFDKQKVGCDVSGDIENGCVRKYSWEEIESVTRDFCKIIGSGGFSTVYLAQLSCSTFGAIKIQVGSDHFNKLFKQELDILLQLRHDNIVKLLGFCDDQEEGVLVFEYVPNGTLQDKLHVVERGVETKTNKESSQLVISWRKRMAIAFQLAQALEYLHEKCSLPIVHGDIKASNILLDNQLNCKLCDFGFAKMGFSSTIMPSSSSTRRMTKQVMMGSPGYTDPHYLRTGLASKKNDVYSYGVVVLELLTGKEAFCEEKGQLLTTIMAPMLRDAQQCETVKLAEMLDPRLAGDFDIKEGRAMLSISALCLGQSPTLRPSATQILHSMKQSIPSISFPSCGNKDLSKKLVIG